jgi:hypothetical protein
MNFVCFTLLGVLALSGGSLAQETQVLAQNAQIKVELSRYSESCSELMATEAPKAPSAPSTCVEMAITNNSPPSITAWIAIVRTGHRPGSSGFVATGIQSIDHILDETANSQEILHRDTHRTILGNPDDVEFKVAIFEDGSFFGDPAWADRIVDNRRRVYQDVVIALQKLRSARELATSDELVREFKDLAQKEEEAEREKRRTLPLPDSLLLPRLGILSTVAASLERDPGPPDKKIDSVMSFLFSIANRLQFSRPPISCHVVPLGEPLEDASAPRVGRAGARALHLR